jgi:hypothetical protein
MCRPFPVHLPATVAAVMGRRRFAVAGWAGNSNWAAAGAPVKLILLRLSVLLKRRIRGISGVLCHLFPEHLYL